MKKILLVSKHYSTNMAKILEKQVSLKKKTEYNSYRWKYYKDYL